MKREKKRELKPILPVDLEAAEAAALQKDLDAIDAMTDPQEVLRLLEENLCMSLRGVIRAAALVRQAEKMKLDLSHLHSPRLEYLRNVACGQLLPQIFFSYQDRMEIVKKIAALPLPDQQRIAEGKGVKLFDLQGGMKEPDPRFLTSFEVRQVFGKHGLRTEADQIIYLREQQEKRPGPAPRPEIVVDRKHGGIIVRIEGAAEKFIPVSDLLRYASELS
jgi:hypothetical protein